MMMMRPVTALLSYSPCQMGRARGRGLEWLKLIRCASDSEVKFEVRTLAVHRDSCRAGQELRPPGAVTTAVTRPGVAESAPRISAIHVPIRVAVVAGQSPERLSLGGRPSPQGHVATRQRPTRSDSDGPDPERAAPVAPGTVTYHPRSSAGTASRDPSPWLHRRHPPPNPAQQGGAVC